MLTELPPVDQYNSHSAAMKKLNELFGTNNKNKLEEKKSEQEDSNGHSIQLTFLKIPPKK
jgi:hypothetical protein